MKLVDDLIAFLRARLDEDQAELDPYLRSPYEGATDDELHSRSAHPAYEYTTTEGQRKAWPYVDEPPEGDGWELNITSRFPDAWERLEYTEERFWRRKRTGPPPQPWQPTATNKRRAADVAAKRQIIEIHKGPHSCVFSDYDDADPCETLRLLALPYVDHPDYRAEWRP